MSEEIIDEKHWLQSVDMDMVVKCSVCDEIIGTIIYQDGRCDLCCKECSIEGFVEALAES